MKIDELIEGTLYHRVLNDGRLVTVVPLTFRRARITIGPLDLIYSDGW
jgi:hypothetical protein